MKLYTFQWIFFLILPLLILFVKYKIFALRLIIFHNHKLKIFQSDIVLKEYIFIKNDDININNVKDFIFLKVKKIYYNDSKKMPCDEYIF